MSKEIQLTQGKISIVDDKDYEYLSQFKWYAAKCRHLFYAQRKLNLPSKKQISIKMHHAIIGKPPNRLITDHKDGNGLNNQRNNLRFVTRRQNAQNIHNMNPTSRFLGVVWV